MVLVLLKNQTDMFFERLLFVFLYLYCY